MTDVPIDEKPGSPAPRVRVGIIGHIGPDKSGLVAALALIDRHSKITGRESAEATVPVDTFPQLKASKDAPFPEVTFGRGHRATWKSRQEDVRRSNRRGRRP